MASILSSSSSLRHLLKSLDGSSVSVQKAAAAMMKHYDQTAVVAVTEWRNALSASTDPRHLISLLYVANEVLQISKRNRGNKFLEAFSTVLGQALQHICVRCAASDPAIIEKVRRTVKIWGDRRVFSVRFVAELLHGLDSFRNNNNTNNNNNNNNLSNKPAKSALKITSTTANNISTNNSNSKNLPNAKPTFPTTTTTSGSIIKTSNSFSPTHSDQQYSPAQDNNSTPAAATDNDDDDFVIGIMEAKQEDDDDDDDDDDDIFASDTTLLKVDIDLEQVPPNQNNNNNQTLLLSNAGGTTTTTNNNNKNITGIKKKGHSSPLLTGEDKPPALKRRRRATSAQPANILSTNSLLELSAKVTQLQEDYEESQRTVQKIEKFLSKTPADYSQIVGDELVSEFRRLIQFQEQYLEERQRWTLLDRKRQTLEQEAMAYLHWLEKTLEQDQVDLEFCQSLQQTLELFSPIHAQLVQARERRRSEELLRLQQEEERERVRKEKEEADRFRQESMRRQTEQSHGMVWNPATREYVKLDTNESWRD